MISHPLAFIADRLVLQRDIYQPIQCETCTDVDSDKPLTNNPEEQVLLRVGTSLITLIKFPFVYLEFS